MRFRSDHRQRFQAVDGAYSKITPREYDDSQVTLADYEAELVISHYGSSQIHTGNVSSNREAASKSFRLYPSGEPINLNMVFPKPDKGELRLYLSAGAGFKPDPGEVWFIFVRNGELWIGALPESEWTE